MTKGIPYFNKSLGHVVKKYTTYLPQRRNYVYICRQDTGSNTCIEPEHRSLFHDKSCLLNYTVTKGLLVVNPVTIVYTSLMTTYGTHSQETFFGFFRRELCGEVMETIIMACRKNNLMNGLRQIRLVD